MKKLISILVAFAMMATLAVSMSFAATYDTNLNPVDLSKTLQMPAGTTTPTKTFHFDFEQDTTNGNASAVAIEDIEIGFNDQDTATPVDGVISITKSYEDIFADVTFTKPGLYIYTVTETQPSEDSNIENGTITNGTSKTTYSLAEYRIKLTVDNTGKITNVVVVKDKNDAGTADTREDAQKKVPYEDTGDGSSFAFVNKYSEKKAITPGSQEDDSTLFVKKTVSAPEGYLDADQTFEFSTTVTFPSIDPSESYTATVVDAEGNTVTTAGGTNGVLTFTPANATQTYNLRHGDRLVFNNIDVGATYTATETESEALTDYDYNSEDTAVSEATYIADTGNSVTVVNTYNKSTTPPEGILISNLPYIALALVAIGGLVAYVVIRRRNADEA